MVDSKNSKDISKKYNKNNSVESLLSEIGMDADEFKKEFGVSVDEFDDDIGESVYQLLDELDLLDEEYKDNQVERANTSGFSLNSNKVEDFNLEDADEDSDDEYHSQIKKIERQIQDNLNDEESISGGIKTVRDFFEENKYVSQNDNDIDEVRTIAFACEIAPAKTIIPVIKLLKKLESEGKLHWKTTRIIGLAHGKGVDELLNQYCDVVYYIGQGRSANQSDSGRFQLASLILRDIYKATRAMIGEQIDLLVTCGNAGDVRKSISAAKLLRTPVLHIEQDIYNPIEIISQANLITVPSKDYEYYLKIQYGLMNVVNIGGYPMAAYVDNEIKNNKLVSKEEITEKYGFEHYILVLLGGDLKKEDLTDLIPLIDGFDYPTLIAPYRFDKGYVEDLSKSSKVKILDNYVDILSLTNSADALIYGAGMGMTIEAGVLKVPSVKIYGYHVFHSSINLAKELNIPIVQIWDIPRALRKLYPPTGDIVKDGQEAIYNIVRLINNFDYSLKKGNIRSTFKIWRARSKFRKSHK